VTVTPELEAYMSSLAVPEPDPVLARIEREAERDGIPAIGPLAGRLLSVVAGMARCRDVLELGAAIGYSAIWLGRACTGRLVTLETNPDRARRARQNLAEAGLAGRVEVREEEALVYLERDRGEVDCVFNDLLNSFAGEGVVERCFELSLERLRPGGLLIADNALSRGEVAQPRSQATRNVDRYNHLVAGEPRLESVIVPLRDGVSIARLR
jgi:caffeoyl-CoA O-methyltransferase